MDRESALPRFELFAGKGGVGKTTSAAARAVRACEAGERVLVVSTDPAHSLGDALGARLRREPTRVRVGRRVMHALELDADRALARWLRSRVRAFRTIAERGTYLDDEDVDRLMGLSLPGVDELVGLLELRRLAGAGAWDLVVVDTAPTGHTLRLLETPEALGRVAHVLDEMQAKHRLLAESLAGRYRPDDADRTIEEIAGDADELRELLRDAERCAITWVMLPEPMSLEESEDGLRALDALGVSVPRILVNRVTPDPACRCSQCTPRVQAERRTIASARKRLHAGGARAIELVAAAEDEPRGVGALSKMAARAGIPPPSGSTGTRVPPPARRGEGSESAGWGDHRLLFFGGKGGVGKTTCAAAAAIALAKAGRKVLLLSTDPAHSVADALGVPVGPETRPIPGATGLHARELDAPAAFAAERERYRDAVDDLFRALVRSPRFDATYDRAVMEDLIDLAPPGIDEILAVVTLVEELERDWDTIVVDTAPTGHTLRLLAMPEAAREWTHALLGILLKYRQVLGLGELASDLLALARRLRALEGLLRDGRRTAFVAVTRAAELPRMETARLLAALARARIPVHAVVVDAVTAGTCPRCARVSARERREIAKLSSSAGPRGILVAPAVYPPPRGVASLARWAGRWTITPPT